MKALFITHSVDNYGASRSLQLLLKNYNDVEVDLLVGVRLSVRSNLYNVRKRFGNKVGHVYWCFLPLDYCYESPPLSPIILFLKDLLWKINAHRVYSIIKNGKHSFVHLNSLGLHPLVTKDHPFFIHVREILSSNANNAMGSLIKAVGVIFIDEATKKPFNSITLKKSIVLNNPFDMTAINSSFTVNLKKPIDYKNKTIFSIIAEHRPMSGTDFVIGSFVDVHNGNSLLLVIGKISKEYLSVCKNAARHDRRVVFYGEEPDINSIYYISDYILRGEAYNCIGRTIFEGLYSGCHVIVPGEPNDGRNFFEYDRFKDRINFYPPRDHESLSSLFRKLGHMKIGDKIGCSNVADYVKKFNSFVEDVVKGLS